MNGMISEVHLNAGPKGQLVDNTAFQSIVNPTHLPFRASDAKIPVPVLTYRSGPRYLRAIESGANPFGETLLDYYTRLQGDLGHEFTMFKPSIKKSWSSGWKLQNYAGFGGITGVGAMSEVRPGIGSYAPVAEAICLVNSSTRPWFLSDASLVTRATGFIRSTQPLASEADLLVSLAELIREGFPLGLVKGLMKPGANRKALVKGFGGDYLNYTFGITPIIRDFDSVYRSLTKIDTTINQWIRDNAHEIRRRRRAERVTSYESLSIPRQQFNGSVQFRSYTAGPDKIGPAFNFNGSGTPTSNTRFYERNGTSKLETDVSFSSRFSYQLSKLLVFDAVPGEVEESNLALRLNLTLHALGLSPEDFSLQLAWNLTPFSWLVDWFVNIGDLFANLRAFQTAGLQMTYGYITAHQVRTVSWNSSFDVFNTSNVHRAHYSQGQIYVEKYVRRIRATPFGFGLKLADLSANQKLILAALATKAL